MMRKTSRKIVDKSECVKFLKVAENFSEASKLAFEFEYYNASGVLIVHSAIALADALTINFAKIKCKGENHYEIVGLLRDMIADSPQKNKAIKQFEEILDEKNRVSYSGDIYLKKDIDKLMKHYDRFYSWVKDLLDFL